MLKKVILLARTNFTTTVSDGFSIVQDNSNDKLKEMREQDVTVVDELSAPINEVNRDINTNRILVDEKFNNRSFFIGIGERGSHSDQKNNIQRYWYDFIAKTSTNIPSCNI